jgi:hypothetical protein
LILKKAIVPEILRTGNTHHLQGEFCSKYMLQLTRNLNINNCTEEYTMATSSLRQALKQRLSTNSGEVLKALKASGVMLSQQEETGLKNGSLEGFSDQQLSQRFNAKVLGALGMSGTFTEGMANNQWKGKPKK